MNFSAGYPLERLAALSTVLRLGVPGEAQRHGVSAEAFIVSRFYAGYLLGYPRYADHISPQIGAGIRTMLFRSVHGPEIGDRFHWRTVRFLEAYDGQTLMGVEAGEEDGTSYFEALEENEVATGHLDRLIVAFQIGKVSVDQQM